MQFVQLGCAQYSVLPLEQNVYVMTKPPHLQMKYGSIYLFIYGSWLDNITLNSSSDEGKMENIFTIKNAEKGPAS